MKGFNKVLLVPLALLAIGGGVGVAAATSGGSDDPIGATAPSSTLGTTTEDRSAREPGEDVSGPCDEAEHANDPRCAGVQVPEDDDAVVDDDVGEVGEDISGPCDEAEHANDPRCTGAAGGDARDDDSGHSGHSGNSGPGSSHSGSDDDDSDDGGHSGHGGGGDDD